ncbi:glycosyltransferase family 2 protein [Enterococcus sp. AZ046]|uniref:glycosyltransferase family 2 protein n=1 Tax=unclassified Enterococcus TaxID=2608891 RepID=UPI003D26B492
MIGISVIIPVYNSEKYIRYTLDKIAKWNYPNLEIIFVDDGSTDNTFEIIKNSQIKNIKVQHQENTGVSKARNMGFQLAEKEYVFFMDSDDYVKDTFFYEMDEIIEKNSKVDLIISKFMFLFEGDNKKVLQDFGTFCGVKDSITSLRLLLSNKIGPLGRNVLFSRKYILDTFGTKPFPEGRTKEDGATAYQFIGYSNKIYFYNKACYYYRQRSESMVHSYKLEDMDNIIKNSEELLYFVKKANLNQFVALSTNFIFHNLFQEYRKQVILNIDNKELKMNKQKINLFLNDFIDVKLLSHKNFLKLLLFKANLFENVLKINLRINRGRKV